MVTASSQGVAFGGEYTATFGAFSSGTASMFESAMVARMRASAAGVDGLDAHAAHGGLPAHVGAVREEEGAAPVVQEPLRLHPLLRASSR